MDVWQVGESTDENTLSLPRDLSLSVSADGRRKEIMQQYVPELQSLRIATSHEAQRLTLVPSAEGLTHWLGLRVKQLELIVRLTPVAGKPLPALFGVRVLCSNKTHSHGAGLSSSGGNELTTIVV